MTHTGVELDWEDDGGLISNSSFGGSIWLGSEGFSSSRGHPIQKGADSVCRSFSTRIRKSLNFQKPFPLKKYVFPEINKQIQYVSNFSSKTTYSCNHLCILS
jgi:hypothetical protein